MITQESIKKMVNGDVDAFCTFYESYAPTVYQKILARISEGSEAKQMLKSVFSDCCLRIRNAGQEADPMAILLEVICDEKLAANGAACPEEAPQAEDVVSEPENPEPEAEFAAATLKPEEVLRQYEEQPEVSEITEEPAEPAQTDTPVEELPQEMPEDVPQEPDEGGVLYSNSTREKVTLEEEPEFEKGVALTWMEESKKHISGWWYVLTAVLVLIFLFLVWGVVGVMGADGLIPQLDLGYDWFNEHVIHFF